MMRSFFLGRIIPALFACTLICSLSVGVGMAQSLNPTAANKTKKVRFLNMAPIKSAPKETSGAGAASAKDNVNSKKKPAVQPQSQIKIPPVRITIGGQGNKRAPIPTIKVSPQDIAKVQKIMELVNIGRKSGR